MLETDPIIFDRSHYKIFECKPTFKAVEFDPNNFDNKIEGYLIGSFLSLYRKLKAENMDMNPSFWEIIDNYIRFIKVNNISPRKDLQKLIFKLNEAETNFNNQFNAGKHDEAKKLLQSRITILTAYAG